MNLLSDNFGLVACAAAILLLRVGMGLHAAGLVRAKNAAGMVLRGVTDLCLVALVFWAIGFALLDRPNYNLPGGAEASMFGSALRPVIGLNPQNFLGGTFLPPVADRAADSLAPLFCLLAAVSLGSAVAVGGLAERCRFAPSLAVTALLAGFLIPLTGHWVWYGWLADLGFIDAGGAAAIHLPGAVAAAVGAMVVGPRAGKYNRDGSTSAIPGHSAPLTSSGAALMLVAWVPYLIALGGGNGFSLGRIALNALMAAAAGGMAGLLFGHYRYRKVDVHVAHAGLLGGLVAITASAVTVDSWQAVLIGAVAGVLVPAATAALDLTWKLDDPGGGVSVHGVGAVWGLLAAGLFGRAGTVADRLENVGVQALGIVVVIALSAGAATVLFALLKRGKRLRVREADEYDGLDLAEHDVSAYPDFNQSMIKSY